MEFSMWRLYRLLVGLVTCNRISKVGGYITTFGAISGAVYLVMTLLYGAENAYAGIIFLAVVPPTFFGGLLLVPLGLYLEFKRRCRRDPRLREKSLGEILQTL